MQTDIYNPLFDNINSLTWYPWIGSNYNINTDAKFLLVGESHYIINENNKFNQSKYDSIIKNKKTTQLVVKDAINCNGLWKFFINTHKAFMGAESFSLTSFWSNVAFYNFIQRPMNNPKDRPNQANYVDGWHNYLEVIKVIKPTHCVFLGSSAADYFNKSFTNSNELIIESAHKHMRFGRFWGKKASITIDGFKTNITFIKHPSSYFTWSDWYEYLSTRNGQAIINLRETIKAQK